ncbi:ROK family protein [Leadbetterella byssophila]|jgi:glucokinase|uniref:ROK family protein n=1 Tax=Leadbetterella byssophila (strain DSM 17132 / JCM 16389 / KACC 11308 / NBRC 106382 / 4M15) TaxID=649349 RepID=E4RT62_LEAB4|nr:ROK family protein [Leadbetterella byssophila]ADQ18600.1 ROK family protein [Leadbetterella byssophila DSM 17132]
MATEYLGIDIGGTNVKMGIVDATNGNIKNFYSHETSSWRASGHFVERLGDAIVLQLKENPDVKKVGIGVPGLISRDRNTLIEITAIPETNGIHIIPVLKERFPDHEFFLENDANAAALGEYYFGEEKLPEDYIFVTLGTGVGGAAIIDKQVFKGGGGNAMEPGHMPSENGKVLERIIGKNELLDMANEMRAAFEGETKLPADGTISTTGLVAAASEGDELALQIFDRVGGLLGDGLVSMIRILDITTVLIGGGLSASFDYILPAIQRQLKYWLTPYYVKTLDIRRATLANDAGLLGAASLCF